MRSDTETLSSEFRPQTFFDLSEVLSSSFSCPPCLLISQTSASPPSERVPLARSKPRSNTGWTTNTQTTTGYHSSPPLYGVLPPSAIWSDDASGTIINATPVQCARTTEAHRQGPRGVPVLVEKQGEQTAGRFAPFHFQTALSCPLSNRASRFPAGRVVIFNAVGCLLIKVESWNACLSHSTWTPSCHAVPLNDAHLWLDSLARLAKVRFTCPGLHIIAIASDLVEYGSDMSRIILGLWLHCRTYAIDLAS